LSCLNAKAWKSITAHNAVASGWTGGELDKIIDKSAGAAAVPVREQAAPTFRDERSHSQHHPKHDHYPHKRKREGFLSDIFDF
jgi:Zn-finger nucleic acid-binding protein